MQKNASRTPEVNPVESAERQRENAVERVMGRDDIRAVLERTRLSEDDVRRKVLADRAEQHGGTVVEDWVVAVDESVSEPLRRSERGVVFDWFVRSDRLVAIVTGLIGTAASLVAAERVGGGSVLETTGVVAAVLAVGTLLVGALRQVMTEATKEQSVREAASETRTTALHQLDEQVERQIRSAINDMTETRFGRHLRPLDVTGLADLSDTSYDVSTAATRALTDSLQHLRAGSIGISGPRGAGKSTLLRQAVDGRLGWTSAGHPLGVEAPAPVRYEAREFVPYLFAKLCLAVLGPHLDAASLKRARRKLLGAQMRIIATLCGAAVAYLVLIHVISLTNAVPVGLAVLALGAFPSVLERLRLVRTDLSLDGLARKNLDRLRYLETRSEEWTAELSSTAAKLSTKRAVSRAAQPWTMPELTTAYVEFVKRISRNRPVIIGIDELDKMASVEEAQRFLNEIKSLFGQPGTYYLITLSDDAMSAFESRGLPLRDVFESVFDDVLRVEPLNLLESANVLHERTVGVAPPFVGLCHAVSGGLPRELIRVAREAIKIAENAECTELADVARKLILARVAARNLAAEVVARRHVGSDGSQPILSWLRALSVGVDSTQLLEQTAIAQVVLNLRASPASKPGLELLLVELAAAGYHAATTLEFFSTVDADGYEAASEASGEQCAIELLARGMRDLSVAPRVAWTTVSEFRTLTGLSPLDYPLGVATAAPTAG